MEKNHDIVLKSVQKNLDTAIVLKQYLYDHPELPCQEVQSSKEIVQTLQAAGYEVEYPFMEGILGYATAFRAVLRNGEGPRVAIMVEYDALPELGHGCGHNFHGALCVLSALALSELREHFSGTLYVIGTPAEEAEGAKVPMADAGAFDNMSLACMMHTWGAPRSQANMDVLALQCYIIEFFGQQAHAAASPWQGRSALAAARKFLDLIDARRECFTPDMRCNAIITDGGKSPNIIPEYASVRLEYRTDSQAKLKRMDESVKKCAQGAALALDCTVTFKSAFDAFADMVRNNSLEKEMSKIMIDYGFEMENIQPPAGSSDVGNVSYRCPTIQTLISVTDANYPLHTVALRECTMQPEAHLRMQNGAAALTSLVLRVFTDQSFRERVENDFKSERALKLGE